MKKVVLKGDDINPERLKEEINRRATKELQGAPAFLEKKLDGDISHALLLIDNGNVLLEDVEGRRNFVYEKFASVEFA